MLIKCYALRFCSLWILANGSMVGLCSAICIKQIDRCERDMETDVWGRNIFYTKLLSKTVTLENFFSADCLFLTQI